MTYWTNKLIFWAIVALVLCMVRFIYLWDNENRGILKKMQSWLIILSLIIITLFASFTIYGTNIKTFLSDSGEVGRWIYEILYPHQGARPVWAPDYEAAAYMCYYGSYVCVALWWWGGLVILTVGYMILLPGLFSASVVYDLLIICFLTFLADALTHDLVATISAKTKRRPLDIKHHTR